MIHLLLPTYNGEAFLPAQLDSLLEQTEQGFCVLAQDDGSGDKTPGLLSAWAASHPGKLRIMAGLPHEKGTRGNVMSLLKASDVEYVMFCDQDDVWHPDKIARSLAVLKEGEARFGRDCPLLVHTDLKVVDRDLAPIAPSFWAYQKLDENPSLKRLLVQNSVTGCTVMMNRSLAEIVKKGPPQDMLMHDWWAALCAASFGHILTLPCTAMDYRQHGRNQLGASGFDALRDARKAAGEGGAVRLRVKDTYRQAAVFLSCYESLLPGQIARAIRRYAGLGEKNKAARVLTILAFKYWKKGFARLLGQLVFC